jgi:hypothetical protein
LAAEAVSASVKAKRLAALVDQDVPVPVM